MAEECFSRPATHFDGGRAATVATAAETMLNCDRAAALFAEGRHDEALDFGRRAFAQSGADFAVATFCAWLFGNCQRYDEAVAAYERGVGLRPGWAEGHRHASSACLAAGTGTGTGERAIAHAVAASDLAPEIAEYAFHAGSLLLDVRRPGEAVAYLARAVQASPDDSEVWRQLSAAATGLGRAAEAVALALHALSLAPDSRVAALHAAETLIQAERAGEAVAILRKAARQSPDDAAVLRALSTAEMLCGAIGPALDAIDRAVAIAPSCAEYHVHRGGLLHRCGAVDAAAAAFAAATLLDPAFPAAWHGRLAACLDGGDFDGAMIAAGELLRRAPANAEHIAAVMHALGHRLDRFDDAPLGVAALPRRRRPRPPRRLVDAAATQWRVIHALVIRETRTRFADARLGYAWAIAEPVLHIVTLSVVFAVLMHGRPPIGTEFVIFYYTGLIPYHLFIHTSGGMTHSIAGNGTLLHLPLVTGFDIAIARFVLEFVTDIVVALVLLSGFGAIGFAVLPDDAWRAAAALLATGLLGCGVGLINAVLGVFVKSWERIWNQLARVLYFASGIFYVPAMMPKWVRDILVWNPVLQAVDWYRSGFFAGYQPHWLDRRYLVVVALAAALGGFALQRLGRRRTDVPS